MVIQKVPLDRLKLPNKSVLAILVIAFITLTGCIESEVGEGKEGITIEFKSYTVKDTIYEEESYSVVADLRNKGRFDSPYGKVLLHGFDRNIMPFNNLEPNKNMARKSLPDLPAKTMFNPDGGYNTVEFSIPRNHIYVPYKGTYTPTLTLSTCYYYETSAAPTVCIAPKPGELNEDSPCRPETINMESQGAPVAITKIEQEMEDWFVNFILTVENVGSGRVIAHTKEGYDNCPNNLGYDDLNIVKVDMNIPNMQDPVCSNEGLARLSNGKGHIFCRFQIRPDSYDEHRMEIDKDSYTQQARIDLKYYYTTKAEQKITVAKRESISGEVEGGSGDRPDLIN